MEKHREIKRDYSKELKRRIPWFRDGDFDKWVANGSKPTSLPTFFVLAGPEEIMMILTGVNIETCDEWANGGCLENEMDPAIAIATQDAVIMFCLSCEALREDSDRGRGETLGFFACIPFMILGATGQFLLRVEKIVSLFVGSYMDRDMLERNLAEARVFFKQVVACEVADFQKFEMLVGVITTIRSMPIREELDELRRLLTKKTA